MSRPTTRALRDAAGKLVRAGSFEDLTPKELNALEHQVGSARAYFYRLMKTLDRLQWPKESTFYKRVVAVENDLMYLRVVFDEHRRLEGVARYYESIRGVPITPCPPSPPQTPAPPPPSAAAPTTTPAG